MTGRFKRRRWYYSPKFWRNLAVSIYKSSFELVSLKATGHFVLPEIKIHTPKWNALRIKKED